MRWPPDRGQLHGQRGRLAARGPVGLVPVVGLGGGHSAGELVRRGFARSGPPSGRGRALTKKNCSARALNGSSGGQAGRRTALVGRSGFRRNPSRFSAITSTNHGVTDLGVTSRTSPIAQLNSTT